MQIDLFDEKLDFLEREGCMRSHHFLEYCAILLEAKELVVLNLSKVLQQVNLLA